MLASEVVMTQWCNEHDLPMRTIRTGDDRIVCWFIWWVEAMDQLYPMDDFAEDNRPPIKACIPSYRVVLAEGSAVVEKEGSM